MMDSHGTGPSSGLGDIKNYWKYPGGQYRLAPGESVSLHNNNWGFTVDPNHQRLSYAFEICWHAEDSAESQCNYQRLNLASDQNVLWTTQDFNEGADLDGMWFASNDAGHFTVVNVEQSGNAISMYMKQSMSLDGSGAINDGNLFRGVLTDTAVSGKISLRNINEINDACVEPGEEWRDMTFRILRAGNRMMGILDIPTSADNQQSGCVLDSDYTRYYYLEKL
jgi:hypothetical protein